MKNINRKFKYILPAAAMSLALGFSSCVKDLDTVPLDEKELVADVVFGSQIDAYESNLAKIYAGLAIGGNSGGDSDQDVVGIDGGSQASFLRVMWNMQELASDIAHCCWNDEGIPDFNNLTWTSSSPFLKGYYFRLFYEINLCNSFLKETTAEELSGKGCSEQDIAVINNFRGEAKFIRALMYMYALDFFRNVPFVTEENKLGENPEQIQAKDLYDFVEKQLLESAEEMADPKPGFSDSYGHANKAAAWAALSRLYLNAKVYTGVEKYTECITYCQKIIDAGYKLEPVYGDMFKADNDQSLEMIMSVRYEGDQTMTWGGMTAILCWGSEKYSTETNAKGGWNGVRAKSSFLDVFEREENHESDQRMAMLRLDGTTSSEIKDEATFKNNGIPVTKFYNVYKDGTLPPSAEAYVDFPLFRLGEIYLNIAEALLRTNNEVDALKYINALHERAGIQSPIDALTLDYLLDERGRETFYEAQRRTDLIRFDKYTSGYNWPWKGGVAEGKDVPAYYSVYPIPSDEIGSNLNLKQNDGYSAK